MDSPYIHQMASMVNTYNVRMLHGAVLTEDEAMFYFATLAYLKQVNRALELGARKINDEEERNEDDENSAGSSAPNPSPPG
jgi:hypothetical protein